MSMAMNIHSALPEYHIIRERDANTAVSLLETMLPQETIGERKKVKKASQRNLFMVLFI